VRVVLALVVALGAVCDARAQDLESYVLASPVLLPDSLSESLGDGPFSILILRSAGSSLERSLLAKAEALHPPPAQIEAATADWVDQRGSPGVWPRYFLEAAEAPGLRWWWREWNTVWLPYALTGAAVQHYLTRIRALASGPNPFARDSTDLDHSGELEYRARVHPGGVDEYVVEMELRWSHSCGSLCGLWLTHRRRVVFDAVGTLIRIEGDQAPEFGVS
jgi:hypothetical protein